MCYGIKKTKQTNIYPPHDPKQIKTLNYLLGFLVNGEAILISEQKATYLFQLSILHQLKGIQSKRLHRPTH